MKALKITLVLAVLITALTSCTQQDLSEDDVLINDTEAYFTGGQVNER